jgi:hypothetical protein
LHCFSFFWIYVTLADQGRDHARIGVEFIARMELATNMFKAFCELYLHYRPRRSWYRISDYKFVFIVEPAIFCANIVSVKRCKCGLEARKGQRHCLACHAAYMRRWRKIHPLTAEQKRRDNCRSYLNVYVRRGKIQRKRCEVCGRKAVEALHLNYAKPLEVKWLCRPHHLVAANNQLL